MAADLISDVSVRDVDAFQTDRSLAAASIERLGGRCLVRGGPIDGLEGHWAPTTIIVVEFQTIEAARAWDGSPEYAAALGWRNDALSRNLILVDGITP